MGRCWGRAWGFEDGCPKRARQVDSAVAAKMQPNEKQMYLPGKSAPKLTKAEVVRVAARVLPSPG